MAIRFLDEDPTQERSIKFIDERPGFMERMGTDLAQRGKTIAESFQATNFPGGEGFTPQAPQSELEFVAQTAGQGIGAAGDVLGNLAISGYRNLVPEETQQDVSSALTQFGQSDAGQALGNIAGNAAQWYGEQSPRTQRNLGALGNLVSLMPVGKATTAAGKGIKQATNTFKKNIDDVILAADKMDYKTLKKASNQAYKQAADLGGQYSPNITKQIIQESKEEFLTMSPTVKKFSTPLKSKLGDDYVESAIDAFDGIKDEAVSIADFDFIDKKLTDFLKNPDLSDNFGSLNGAGMKIKGMQQKLRDKVLNASKDDMVGSGEGFEALSKARELWSKQLKMRDLEEMIGRALNTKQPNSTLKKYFGNLSNKIETGGKTAFKYTTDEADIIKKIANTGKIDEFLSLFGSRLPSSIATGTGDFVTGAALRGASELPRNLATKATLNQTQNLMNVIAGAPTESMGKALTRSTIKGGLNAPANVLGMLGTGLQYRAPQLTALGLINQENEQ
jgi:hypothetical protein